MLCAVYPTMDLQIRQVLIPRQRLKPWIVLASTNPKRYFSSSKGWIEGNICIPAWHVSGSIGLIEAGRGVRVAWTAFLRKLWWKAQIPVGSCSRGGQPLQSQFHKHRTSSSQLEFCHNESKKPKFLWVSALEGWGLLHFLPTSIAITISFAIWR